MGKLYVVGLGPGNPEGLTAAALAALERCDLIAGYQTYVDLIRTRFPDKELLSTSMRQETQRCRMALAEAAKGRQVAMVCSGDPGVYGMAGLIYQLWKEYPQVELEVVPGVTAACSGAALLGAPLGHDFAVISLSDLLTPWETIEKRLEAAALGDFCICLYNPSSKKRGDYLRRACEILLRHRAPENPVGVVRNIGRDGQMAQVMTLAQLQNYQADMFTTVFIGNSQTQLIGNKMVTPRGYREVQE